MLEPAGAGSNAQVIGERYLSGEESVKMRILHEMYSITSLS
jgi:hypothetical protein